MVCGIVDVGSNTMRLSLYKYENGTGHLLMNRKAMAGLADYVEGGALSEAGIAVACQVLGEFQELLSNLGVRDLHVFATASLRNISNTAEAVACIRQQTGLHVDVLSGEEEAMLSFRGAVQGAHLDGGLLVDLGGGSTELVRYEGREILSTGSLSLGSLSLYSRFVSGLLPEKKERRAIREAVAIQLRQQMPSSLPAGRICGVGGTVRAACKVINRMYGRSPARREIERRELRALLRRFKDAEREDLHLLLQLAPDRVHTLLPGILALDTIAEECGCETIVVSTRGVREGYFYEKVLKEALSS